MKISFIIPVYNCKTLLPDCISSIRSAGIPDYELLLIDDGSNDGSGALCDELASSFPEIRVVHQPNTGASAARNRGIRESSGELILFIDADDSLDSHALAEVLSDPRCAESDLTVFGLTFDYYYHGQCYRRDPLFFPYDGVLNTDAWGEKFLQLYFHNSLSPLWNKVFQRRILIAHQLLLNESMFLYEDFEFVLRYLQHCKTLWNIPKSIYHYRQAEDEGNARRRLARIHSIPDFLIPIEAALKNLCITNPALSEEQTAELLRKLYLILAKEKISVSSISGIRRICQDFIQWSKNRTLITEKNQFQQRLQHGQAISLYLSYKKTALRHYVAVRVKAFLKRKN